MTRWIHTPATGSGTRANPYRPPDGWQNIVSLQSYASGGFIAVGADATPLPAGSRDLQTGPQLTGTPLDNLWNTLTTSSAHPLMPQTDGNLVLWGLDNVPLRILPVQTSDIEWAAILERERANYALVRSDTLLGLHPQEFHRRWLDMLMEKYRHHTLDYRTFQFGLPDEPPLAHGTTITESFNTADSDTLGPDLTWTETAGDLDIVSNVASLTTTLSDSFARAESDLAGGDHYTQASIVTLTQEAWAAVCVRFASAATTGYLAYMINDTGSDRTEIWRFDGAASFTGPLRSTTETFSLPDTIYLEINGSTLQCKFNGVNSGASVTDATYSGQTRTGLSGYTDGATRAQWDSFQAADLSAANTRRYTLTTLGVG